MHPSFETHCGAPVKKKFHTSSTVRMKKGHTPKATCQNVGAHKYIHTTSDWTKRSRWIKISEKQRKMLKYDLEAVPLVFQNCMCRFKYTFSQKKLKPEEPLYKHYIRECFYYKPWSLIYYLCTYNTIPKYSLILRSFCQRFGGGMM